MYFEMIYVPFCHEWILVSFVQCVCLCIICATYYMMYTFIFNLRGFETLKVDKGSTNENSIYCFVWTSRTKNNELSGKNDMTPWRYGIDGKIPWANPGLFRSCWVNKFKLLRDAHQFLIAIVWIAWNNKTKFE